MDCRRVHRRPSNLGVTAPQCHTVRSWLTDARDTSCRADTITVPRPDTLVSVRWIRSGTGVPSSILVPIAIGALVVLTVVRFVSLAILLNVDPEDHHSRTKEVPMKRKAKLMATSLIETVWALVVSMGAGLLPLS